MTEIDLYRLKVAAHELGHLFAFRHAGIEVNGIYVVGRGTRTYGHVEVNDSRLDDSQQRGLLVGILAGEEAGVRWCDKYGLDPSFGHAGCDSDHAAIRRDRKHPAVRNIPVRELRSDARRLVRLHWSRIARLTPRLAARGSLPVR